MLNKIRIRPATLADVIAVSRRLSKRHQDQEETIITLAAAKSAQALVGLRGETPIAVFGAIPSEWCSSIGVLWMAATSDLNPKTLLRYSARCLRLLESGFQVLVDPVEPGDAPTMRWMQRQGFKHVCTVSEKLILFRETGHV